MNLSDETLMAYVDGELDIATRERVAGAVATDPELARRVAAHEALRARLRATFDKVIEEPVPPQLLSLARAGTHETTRSRIVQFPGRRTARPAWLHWTSLAASFLLGALVWQFGSRLYAPEPLRGVQGGFVAAGTLARALSAQLAAEQNPAAEVHIGVSFRSRQGGYCRTFELRGSQATAGLACHEGDDWKMQVLAGEAGSQAPDRYRQAGSSLSPAILHAVDELIAGDPLDASGETQARASGWRAKP